MSKINLLNDVFSAEEAAEQIGCTHRTILNNGGKIVAEHPEYEQHIRIIGKRMILTAFGIALIRNYTKPVGRPKSKECAKQDKKQHKKENNI